MKLEKQVVSLELSKKLKELGVKQKSLFEWSIEYKKKNGERSTQLMGGVYGIKVFHDISWRVYDYSKRETYSAFTVAELGEMLPEESKHFIMPDFPNYTLLMTKFQDYFYVKYTNGIHNLGTNSTKRDKNEANVRAKMLIYLIENKLLK